MASAASRGAAGRRLGDYVLIRRIAVGGMAEIFEARLADEEVVADESPPLVVKIPLPQYSGDSEFMRGFEHEARLHASLSHPNLVGVVEYGVAKGQPFLVMERVDGLSLGDLIRWLRSEPDCSMSPELALFVTLELLDALAYVHEATDRDGAPLGIVHRDVSPQNVLLTRAGQVRLGDFGIARSALRDTRTRTGVMKGKLRYMAPEQVTCSAIDGRADLYAAGCILWELLVEEPFVAGESEVELLRAAEAPEFRRPSAVASVDGFFDRPLRRALARFPEERTASASSFKKGLADAPSQLDGSVAREALGALVVQAIDGGALRPAEWADEVAHDPRDARTRRVTPSAPPAQGAADSTRSEATAAGRRWLPLALLAGAVAVIVAAMGWPRAQSVAPGVPALDPAAGHDRDGQGGDRRGDDRSHSEHESVGDPTFVDSASPIRDSAGRGGSPSSMVSSPEASGPAPAATGDEPLGGGGGAPGTEPPEQGDPARSAELQRRLTGLRSSLSSRGILLSDLSPDQRSALASAETQRAGHQYDAAEATLGELERAVRAIRIDQAFVKAKLDRTNALLRRARDQGSSSPKIEQLAAAALEAYMTGRYTATNQRLNQIRGMLAAAGPQRWNRGG